MERLLPLCITLAGLAVLSGVFILKKRKNFFSALRENFPFSLLWFFGLLTLHFQFTQVFYAKLGLLRMGFLCICFLFLAWIFVNHVVRKKERIAGMLLGFLTIFYSVLSLFIVLEGIFIFPSRTHGYMVTFASMNWYYRYGGPYDDEGYRGRSIPEDEYNNKKIILMLGDSFLAGSGVKDVNDRFSSLLEENLKEKFVVANRGVGGHGSGKELAELYAFKHKPSLILLSWFPDDILGAADSLGKTLLVRHDYPGLDPARKFFVTHSYLFNYLYWSSPHENFPDFGNHIKEIYNDQKILKAHFQDIAKMKAHADSIGAPFVVMVWPFLQDIDGSVFATKPMEDWLRENKIPCLDLSTILRPWLGKENLVVNQNDGHPNEFAHQMVADALQAFLEKDVLKDSLKF